MCRDKMMRLRCLYIAQFKRLQHVLKERKRKYCLAIQAEEEEEAGGMRSDEFKSVKCIFVFSRVALPVFCFSFCFVLFCFLT